MTNRFLAKIKPKIILLSILFLCSHPKGVAQDLLKGVSIESNLYAGSMVKHTPNMIGSPKGPARGLIMGASFQTHGAKTWQSAYKYPVLGFYAGYMNIDNGDIFGDAYFAAPYFLYYLKQKNNYKTFLMVGMGGAYVTKKYNEANNVENNAIGSHWNGAFNLRYGYQWTLSPNIFFTSSIGVNHFSNAGVTPTNLGINIFDAQLGLRYAFQPISETEYQSNTPTVPNQRWTVDASFYNGFVQHIATSGGAYYPIHNLNLNIGYHRNYKHRWLAGLEYEYNTRVHEALNKNGRFASDEARFWQSTRFMVYVGDEIKIGNFAVLINWGVYFKRNYHVFRAHYNKYALRYYMLNTQHWRLHLTAFLKTELIDAEYVGLGLGFQFR